MFCLKYSKQQEVGFSEGYKLNLESILPSIKKIWYPASQCPSPLIWLIWGRVIDYHTVPINILLEDKGKTSTLESDPVRNVCRKTRKRLKPERKCFVMCFCVIFRPSGSNDASETSRIAAVVPLNKRFLLRCARGRSVFGAQSITWRWDYTVLRRGKSASKLLVSITCCPPLWTDAAQWFSVKISCSRDFSVDSEDLQGIADPLFLKTQALIHLLVSIKFMSCVIR